MSGKDNSWKRFPFVDKFDKHERFYALPTVRPDGFRRGMIYLPFGKPRDPEESGQGRVLKYGVSPEREYSPCFTFDYMLTCFGVACLRIRNQVFELHGLQLDQDIELIEFYVKDGFRMRIGMLFEAGSNAHRNIAEKRDELDAKAREICASIYADHYEEAEAHYRKWYDWCYPDMTMNVDPSLPAAHIAGIIADTQGLEWIPDTALVMKSKKAMDEERPR